MLKTSAVNPDETNYYLSGLQKAIEKKTGFQLYPNPASDKISIQTTTAGILTLSDLSGRAVVTQAVNASNTAIDVHTGHLSPGVYIYQFVSHDKELINNGKLVIVK